MQASHATMSGVRSSDVTELLRGRGPFLSLYLTTESDIANAAQRSDQHWKSLRRQLADDGAPEELLSSVDPLVGPAHLEGETLVVLARADGRRVIDHPSTPPVRDLARWSALPTLVPLLEWRQRSVPHVVVVTDRHGADILTVAGDGSEREREVEGDDKPLRKSGPGGWSQRRYQERAENTWEQTAEEVAAEVAASAARVGARLVVVAGDVRAVALLREHLPREVDDLVHEIGGGRSPDGSADHIAAEAVRLVDTEVGADLRRALEDLDAKGAHGLAVSGAAEVAGALNEARVDVLFVPGDPAETPAAYSGREPVPVSMSADVLGDMAVDDVVEAPLVDVFVRAALGTDASVRVVPSDRKLPGGCAALLRW